MKNFLILINLSMVLSLFSWIGNADKESVVNAKENVQRKVRSGVAALEDKTDPVFDYIFNSKKVDAKNTDAADEEVSQFILEASEARLMDFEQGKLAEQRATFRGLKDYGTLMVEDQTKMLDDLRKIAADKGMTITKTLGEKRSDGLADLKELQGTKFDAKFIKMMTIDHKHDLREFKKAAESKDADIQVFATKYLPVIESHLDKIKSLKKSKQ